LNCPLDDSGKTLVDLVQLNGNSASFDQIYFE